jgi:hypothetical protein
MKQLSIILTVISLLALVAICEAATSATINISATVPSALELSWGMSKVDTTPDVYGDAEVWTPNQTAMAFGTMVHTYRDAAGVVQESGRWFSRYYFPIFMSAITGGSKYKITHVSSGFTTGPATFPDAWGIGFIGCWDNTTTPEREKTCPTGAIKGSNGTAKVAAPGKTLYDSGVGAETALVRVDYSIGPKKADGTEPFPGCVAVGLSQKGGDYSGTMTITLATYL